MLMMVDAARSASAKTVHVVIPYYSYGRSDKRSATHPITARLADLIHTAGASHDDHDSAPSSGARFYHTDRPFSLSHAVFVRHFRTRDLTDTVVVSPDIGHAAYQTCPCAGYGVAVGDKERVADDRVRLPIIGEVEAKNVILFDDEIATGGLSWRWWMYCVPRALKDYPGVHPTGVFRKLIERLRASRKSTRLSPPTQYRSRLKVAAQYDRPSVAPIFGEAIRRNVMGLSVARCRISSPTLKTATRL